MISKGFLIHTQSLRLGLFLNQYRVVGNYRDGLLTTGFVEFCIIKQQQLVKSTALKQVNLNSQTMLVSQNQYFQIIKVQQKITAE